MAAFIAASRDNCIRYSTMGCKAGARKGPGRYARVILSQGTFLKSHFDGSTV